MPTLNNVRLEAFTIFKWVGLALAVLLGIFILFKLLFFVKNIIAPSAPPKPASSFGKLPQPFFPQEPAGHFSYTLDTLSGDLPEFPDRTRVYKMTESKPNLLAVKDASGNVSGLGFQDSPEALSDSIYRWKAGDALSRILVLNVNLAQANLSSTFLTDPNIITANNFPDQKNALQIVKDFLAALNVYPDDIDDDKTRVDLLKLNNGAIQDAASISTAQFISVYFFQKDINNLPVVYPGGKNSPMNVTVSGGESGPEIVDARFFYQKVSNDYSDYPIKTSKDAFTELTKKGAYVASVDPNSSNISIKKVYLALYSPGREQKYLEPVIVFEGDHNFIAYLPAVTGEWTSN